ncbi:hypothetical protein IWX78_002880 [Mycetocola sp. CAN_C7]
MSPEPRPVARVVTADAETGEAIENEARTITGLAPDKFESRYLHSSRWADLLILKNGLPPLHLVKTGEEYWLAEDTTGLLVNVANTTLRKMGLWTFKIRGLNHHTAAARAGNFSPGSRVLLVREPDNEHDSNAVAVHAANVSGVVGYVNKGMAPGIAKALDAGEQLTAIALRGSLAGRNNDAVKVIATSPKLMAHLQRRF